MAKKSLPAQSSPQSFQEDLVRDTEGAVMPDASTTGEALRRIQADAPVFYSEVISVKGLIAALTVGLGIGAYFVYRATRKSQSESFSDSLTDTDSKSESAA